MKHWRETAEIVDRVAALCREGREAALATVVDIGGSAYRRPGAKLLIDDGGTLLGGVSGGCLEADVREHALAIVRAGTPRLLHYETGSDADTVWGLGLGCEGAVDIFLQPATHGPFQHLLEPLAVYLEGDAPIAVATVVEGPIGVGGVIVTSTHRRPAGTTRNDALDDALSAQAAVCLTGGQSATCEVAGARAFVEILLPPPHLVVVGGGADGEALAACAAPTGFRVTVVDHREAQLAPARYPTGTRTVRRPPDEGTAGLPAGPDTYVVVKNHSLRHDREWLRAFLRTEAAYVGVLGPRARTEQILADVDAGDAPRVFGPVGLDLGADGPEQIALAIVAEILAVRAGRTPRHLRDREAAIHAG